MGGFANQSFLTQVPLSFKQEAIKQELLSSLCNDFHPAAGWWVVIPMTIDHLTGLQMEGVSNHYFVFFFFFQDVYIDMCMFLKSQTIQNRLFIF